MWGGWCLPVQWPNPSRNGVDVLYLSFVTLSDQQRIYAGPYAGLRLGLQPTFLLLALPGVWKLFVVTHCGEDFFVCFASSHVSELCCSEKQGE